MKKSNGFTLIELLAVISILAILAIISLPSITGMFNTAKKNTFMNEIKQIYRVGQRQWVYDSKFKTGPIVYASCETCNTNTLDVTGRKELNYYLAFDPEGEVVGFCATDGTYQYYTQDDTNVLTAVDSEIEQIAELTLDQTLAIHRNSCIPLAMVDDLPDEPSTYSFYVDNKTFLYEEGMRWNEWFNTTYPYGGEVRSQFYIDNGMVIYSQGCYGSNYILKNVNINDLIESRTYELEFLMDARC